MASMFGRFAKLSFSPAVRASRNGVQRRFISEQTHAPHLEIDANARGNVLLLVGLVALPLSIYTAWKYAQVPTLAEYEKRYGRLPPEIREKFTNVEQD